MHVARHVAVVAGHAPSLVRFRGRLLADMVQAGHRVTALAPPAEFDPDTGERDESFEQALADLGAAFEPIALSRRGLNPLSEMGAQNALTKRFLGLKPDLVFSYTIKPVIWGSLAAKKAGVPRIFSLVSGLGRGFAAQTRKQSSFWTGLRDNVLQGIVTGLYRRAVACNDLVFFQNPDDERLFRTKGILGATPSLVVNGSGVDLDEFPAVPPAPPPPVFLCLARLLTDKGILEYAEAARRLRRVFPQVRCLLAGPRETGPGSLDPAEAERWKSEPGLEYLGNQADVRPLLAQCAAYVLPSYYGEGLPRSSLEALATARPVITTDHPGCREAVQDGVTGLLVPPRDADALEQAMARFIQEPELSAAMGRAARKSAEERFDVAKVNAAMLQAMGLAPDESQGAGA